MLDLIPAFGNVTFTIVAFVVALTVIVAIHELGHYLAGRWSGIEADVFSVGFGPVLWSRMDRRGTRWQVAAIPAGGYVKFRGDTNATSMGGNVAEIAATERRRTMMGAPLWARAVTVAAGPIANFLLSILLFAAIGLWQGRVASPLTVADLPDLPGYDLGLEVGDQILAVGGAPLVDGELDSESLARVPDTTRVDWRVRRDGQEITVDGAHPMLPLVGSVMPDSAARDAGLESGDLILAIDGMEIGMFRDLQARVEGSNGAPLRLTVRRGGETFETDLRPRRVDSPTEDGGYETHWRLGVTSGAFFTPATEPMSPVQAARDGVAGVWNIVTVTLSALSHLIAGDISTCNLSGPIGIAQVSGEMASDGALTFLVFLAGLSTAVGLMNLFPIPMLDGGHLVFHAWEAVTGRPPSERALRALMGAGVAIVAGLTAFALLNDVILCP